MTERQDYIERTKAQLDEWSAKIDELKAKAEQAEARARAEYLEQVAQLRENRDHARQKLDALADAGDAAWGDMKAGFEAAWSNLHSAMREASSRFD